MLTKIIKQATTFLIITSAANINADVIQSLNLPFTLEYESNPQLASTNEQSISRAVLTPKYSLKLNKDADQWHTDVSVRIERSSDQKIRQDRQDPSLSAGWQHSYETGYFGLTGSLKEQTTRLNETAESGLSGDNTQRAESFSANWLNTLNERSSLTLGSSVSNVSFKGIDTTGLIDYKNESVNARYGYSLNDKMEVFSNIGFTQYTPETSNAEISKTKSLDIGLQWKAAEKLNMTVSVGGNETAKDNQQSSDQSWQGSLNLQYETQRTNSQLAISKSKKPSSQGDINDVGAVNASIGYSLTEKQNINFGVNWVQNKTQNNSETKQYSVNYTQQISLLWDFSFSAIHKTRNDNQSKASSDSVMAGIVYRLPEF